MKSFLQGKRSLDVAPLRAPQVAKPPVDASAVSGAAVQPESAADCGASPHVEIVKQGDKVVRIVVTCTCGERTEIDCLYSPGQ